MSRDDLASSVRVRLHHQQAAMANFRTQADYNVRPCSVHQSENLAVQTVLPQVDWEDYNYPPLLKVIHYNVNDIEVGCPITPPSVRVNHCKIIDDTSSHVQDVKARRAVRLAHWSYLAVVTTLIMNGNAHCYLPTSGMSGTADFFVRVGSGSNDRSCKRRCGKQTSAGSLRGVQPRDCGSFGNVWVLQLLQGDGNSERKAHQELLHC